MREYVVSVSCEHVRSGTKYEVYEVRVAENEEQARELAEMRDEENALEADPYHVNGSKVVQWTTV